MKRKGLILGVVIAFVIVSLTSSACEIGQWGMGPKRIVYNYLSFLTKIGFLPSREAGSGIFSDRAPNDSLIYIEDEDLNRVLNSVSEKYIGEKYKVEEIIGDVNQALEEKRYNLRGVRELVDNYLGKEENGAYQGQVEGLYWAMVDFMDILGIDPEASVEVKMNLVYPIVSDYTYRHRTYASYSRPETEMKMGEFLKRTIIRSLIMGASPDDVTESLYSGIELSEFTPLKDYLGGEIDVSNPYHLQQLLYWGQVKYLLDNFTPQQLVANGYGNLVREIEALKATALIKTDPKGIIVASQNFPEKVADEYISTWLQIATELVPKLESFYGKTLNIYDPYDAGIIGSWVSAVFEKFREKRYDPVSQDFSLGSTDYTLDSAKKAIFRFVELAGDLKQKLVDAGYGELPITKDTSKGAWARDIVNLYSNIALFLEEENLTAGKDSLELVAQLLPNGEKGSALANKLVELYKRCGVEKEVTDFYKSFQKRGNPHDWMAYGGFINLGTQIYRYANYFGLDKKNLDFDAIWGENGEVAKMIQLGLDMGLPEKIKDYLGISADRRLPIEEGYIAGIYTFWNQVLYAVANSVDDPELAKRYVWAQLDARKKIREELQNLEHNISVVAPEGAVASDEVALLTFLEKTLDPQWAGLEDSLKSILSSVQAKAQELAERGESLDVDYLRKAIADGYFDNLPQPEFRLYPRGISEAKTWDWNKLLSGGPTADLLDENTFGFVAPVEDSGNQDTATTPEFGNLDLPPSLL
ncbi:hypothetical protein J7K43_08715 [Candidatus Calescamantes bacterium]|nr:hypothetical protein [Candidatus Calescamantes bacterium]